MLQGFRIVQAAQIAAAVLGALCMLGLSAVLGQGRPLLSRLPALLGAGAATLSSFNAMRLLDVCIRAHIHSKIC